MSSAALTGAAFGAHAQEGTAFQLDPIVVEARDEQAFAADRATAVYVSDAELERARIGDLKDLFAGVASVSVGGGIPIAQKIYVNGVDMLNLAVTVDGVLQNNRAFHHVSANAIDPGLLKAVRADAGVAAADTGPNALAGAVVMETVDAADILEDGRSFGGNVRLGYADNGETFTRALTIAGIQGGFEWLGYIKSATGEDYTTGGGDDILGSAADLQSYLLKLAYEAAEGHRFEFSAQRLDDDALRPWRANFGGLNPPRPDQILRRYDTGRSSYSFSYENTLADGIWDPKVVLGYSESLIDVPHPYESEGTSSAWSGTVQNTFNLSGVDTIVAGIDFYDRIGRYEGPGERYEEGAQNIGLFAQARLEPTDRWKLSFGARADWQEFDGIGGYRDDVSGMSGNLSLAYDLTDELEVRAGYSSVFGGIGIEDNYTFLPSWDYDGLKPARAQNVTAGLDWTRGDLTIGGEIFVTEIDNARSTTDNFDFKSEGFNLGVGYGWTGGFARLTYSNSEVTVNGGAAGSYDALDFGTPIGQVLALQAQHTLAGTDLTFGGSLDLAMDYDDTEKVSDLPLDGYEVVSLFVEYIPPQLDRLTLRAEVNNLFDVDYADRATYGADYLDVEPLSEPGRTITLSAVARF
ncbi:TonB-dependent receptor [Frigidibacter albus]|uniref:TonB-dependent receptor n=1 Tax=Frigidibacter albus TaxID=1465486 RepID=A0A6L8VDA8_9RHOB|nr:TonB-dependent receptor [Frigidibacter albus]MZQ87701.1 TonB-dependent receptor [Frigidibacter albus]NBE29607.1 TonB-dependent receptor [Frigidibacter albus]